MRSCKFLSKPINIDQTKDIEEYVKEQNAKFKNDFVDNITYINGLPIIVTHKVDNNDYGEILNKPEYKYTSFAHIASRKIVPNSKKRDLNEKRLRSCNWVKELIDIYNNMVENCMNCQYYYCWEEGRQIYIYCTNVRYVVILEKVKNFGDLSIPYKQYYVINTAYYVDMQYEHQGLINKYNKNK